MKKNSSVRALENKANKGDINALFQLAEYYAQGQFVTQDIALANLYYEKVLAAFINPTIQLSSLKLINFRPFKEIELDFTKQPNFTVLVGVTLGVTVLVGVLVGVTEGVGVFVGVWVGVLVGVGVGGIGGKTPLLTNTTLWT